jgi:hypothetical protein
MEHKIKLINIFATALLASYIVGCGNQMPASSPEPQAQAPANSLPEGLLSTSPLGDALGVVEARKDVKPDANIVITGYVGGLAAPLVDGRSIFTLADAEAMTRCDAVPGDGCSTPWDACCVSSEIKTASIASIQVLDTDGTVLKQTLEGFGGIKPGSTVTVQGKIDPGSSNSVLIVNAEKIHVPEQL